jgi:hypothetical protein
MRLAKRPDTGSHVRLWTASHRHPERKVRLLAVWILVKGLFAQNSFNSFIQNELKMLRIGVLFR